MQNDSSCNAQMNSSASGRVDDNIFSQSKRRCGAKKDWNLKGFSKGKCYLSHVSLRTTGPTNNNIDQRLQTTYSCVHGYVGNLFSTCKPLAYTV